MSVDHVRHCANAVLEALRPCGDNAAYTELERLIGDLDDTGHLEQTLHALIAWADTAAFGDQPVGQMPLAQWWAWLRRLRESCREDLEGRQLETVRQAARDGVPLPAPALRPVALNPLPVPIGRRLQPSGLALMMTGGAIGIAGSVCTATIMTGMPLDRPADLIFSGAIAMAALVSGALALIARRRRPVRIAPAE